MGKYLVGIDGGTTTTKAAVFDLEGKQISLAMQESEGIYPQPGFAEYDPETVKVQMFSTCREAITKSGIDPKDILAVSLSTASPVIYILDESREPLYNAIGWQDARGAPYIEKAMASYKMPMEKQKSLTGSGLSYLTSELKIMWLKENLPEVFNAAKMFTDAQGFSLNCFGASETHIDNGSACRMRLQNIDTFGVADELLEDIGISSELFPRITESGTVVGSIPEDVAELSGLCAGTPLVMGGHDQACSPVGSGVVNAGEVTINCGTFGMVCAVTDSKPSTDSLLVVKTNLGTKNWSIEGMSISSAVNFKWFRDIFGQAEKIVGPSIQTSPYTLLDAQARLSTIGANGITYLPYLNGNIMGTNQNPAARGTFVGMALTTSRADMVRAVLEGVCYELYDLFRIEQGVGCEMKKIRLSGGVTYSSFWCQMFADVFGVPIELTDNEESGTLGAAMFAGIGAGVYRDVYDAVDKCVKVTKSYTPDAKAHEAYEEAFKKYMDVGAKLNA